MSMMQGKVNVKSPFDKKQSVTEMFDESIPVPREVKSIGKSQDWIKGNFYINYSLKKKYTPTSEYEKSYFTFETKMSISIKRNQFGSKSVYLNFELPEHFDDFCKVKVLKTANENLKDPKVISEIVNKVLKAIENSPDGLLTISNRISTTPTEIKKGNL